MGSERFTETAVPQTLVLTPEWNNSPHVSAVLTEQYKLHTVITLVVCVWSITNGIIFVPYKAKNII